MGLGVAQIGGGNSTAGVTSFNTRTGAVTPVLGDYSFTYTTAQRDALTGVKAGSVIFNSDTGRMEFAIAPSPSPVWKSFVRLDGDSMTGALTVGGLMTATRGRFVNTSGGFTSSNYLVVEGSLTDNSNYPGIQLKGGNTATTFPEIVLSNAGLNLLWRSGSGGGSPRMEAGFNSTYGYYVGRIDTGPNYYQITGPTTGKTMFGSGNLITEVNIAGRVTVVEPTKGQCVLSLQTATVADTITVLRYQNRVTTTDATPTVLHTLSISANKTYYLKGTVIARRTGGTAGSSDDAASYVIEATYKTVGGVVTLVGVKTVTANEDQPAWDGDFIISGTNINVQVTGAVNNNITWHMVDLTVAFVGS